MNLLLPEKSLTKRLMVALETDGYTLNPVPTFILLGAPSILNVRYPSYHLYVACVGDDVVGTFALLVMDNLGHLGRPSAIVEDVAVDPQFQKRGIGRTMIKFAMNRAREAGCYKMTLSSASNRRDAHRFYESLGFDRHGYSFHVSLDA